MKDVELKLKWWVFDQNNSGGYFIQNDDVDHYVAIQAIDAKHARQRAQDVFEDYSEYCDCCGERWYYWVDEDDGKEVPKIYGEPYTDCKASSYREFMVLHYVDGTREKYKFQEE